VNVNGSCPRTPSSTTDHDEWVLQLEQVTKDRRRQNVTIEILHPAYGDEPRAERLPFAYAAYDPKDHVVDVDDGGLKVVEKDGTTTITSFNRPQGQA
jgi:hypothetical protein